ncbi:SAM-dependent methyltransferase [Thermogutta sp.]|uniref:SAM-dependent methyltransferase n=1 Tax=Thermogutta sp. TaxID=1962930 RepID=UPI00321FAF64
MTALPPFIFATCQSGVENVLKREVARQYPFLRPAFSRRGFVTFKFADETHPLEGFRFEAVFARAWGFTLGQIDVRDQAEAARQLWALIAEIPVRMIHVWPRDSAPPGRSDPDTPWSSEVEKIRSLIQAAAPESVNLVPPETSPSRRLRGQWALDCVIVEPNEWWVGIHRLEGPETFYPGGRFPLSLPEHAVSRAYLKMEEALRWSQFPIPPNARWAELGSAPGGASQALLDRGYEVLGVDPAEMHPAVLSHPKFTHLRRRTTQAPRRAFRKIRWLAADINAAPNYTLDAVESLVTYPQINVRGMILTLKLPEWSLADKIPEYLERIRGWGYNVVRARHLWYNKQEICVAALMRPFKRKPVVLRQRARRKPAS